MRGFFVIFKRYDFFALCLQKTPARAATHAQVKSTFWGISGLSTNKDLGAKKVFGCLGLFWAFGLTSWKVCHSNVPHLEKS